MIRLHPARLLPALALLLALALPALLRAAVVDLQILATTDLHASFTQGEEEDRGGWLRLASLIRDRRAAAPARTLLVDCGDTTQGTLVAQLSRGEASLLLLDALEYDAWVPGNHEFDFGTARLREFCQRQAPRLLCGNLTLGRGGARLRPPAWRLVERDGARVALIGATATYLAQWLWGDAMAGYEVEPALDMLKRVMPEVHAAQPDLIVLLIHQGWTPNDPRGVNELPAIVRRFPEIDLVLGGHTHQPQPGIRIGTRTWYVQAGNYAGRLAVVRARVDTVRHELVDIQSELLEAGPAVRFDPLARAAVQPWLDRADRTAGQPVARLGGTVSGTGTPGETCATSELICEALAAATGAEAVFHGKLSQAGLPAGTVREGNLFAVIPFENTVGIALLTPGQIRTVIEEQWPLRGGSSYNAPWGLQVTIGADGKVRDLRDAAGQPLLPTRRLRVAFNSYVVAGNGGRNPRLREILRLPESALRDTGVNTRDALRDHLRLRMAGRGGRTRTWVRRED